MLAVSIANLLTYKIKKTSGEGGGKWNSVPL